MTKHRSIEPLGEFAARMVRNKYAHTKDSGYKESWSEIATRVAESVVRPYLPDLVEPIREAIEYRELMPGGRYLYAAGRRYQQLNNCLAGDTEVVTSQGILPLKSLVGKSFQVRNRHGRWEEATAHSFGIQRLFKVTFSNGEEVLATRNHRWCLPSGGFSTTTRVRKVALVEPIVPLLDEKAIMHGICFGDGTRVKSQSTDRLVLCTPEKQALGSYFPQNGDMAHTPAGLTIKRLPKGYKDLPALSPCSPEYARGFVAGLIATDGSTKTSTVTISCQGKSKARSIAKLAVLGGCVVNGVIRQKGDETPYGKRAEPLFVISIKPITAPIIRPDQVKEIQARRLRLCKMYLRVVSVEDTGRDEEVYCCVVPSSESFSLANGLGSGNCFLFRAEDSREGWADLDHDVTSALMTGGGVGTDYSRLRPSQSYIEGMGGQSTGPLALMNIQNEKGRFIRQGGSRRSALWAGLIWHHPDAMAFVGMKDWPAWVRKRRRLDFNFPAPMDGTNISIILDDDFFEAYGTPGWSKTFKLGHTTYTVTHEDAHNIYWTSVRNMLKDGEPGFSVDIGPNSGENLRNACTEVTSRTNRDMCNLASINLARVRTIERFHELCRLGVAFLLCGTLASKLPVESMYSVRQMNRRLGLGLMGIHEFLLVRGSRYAPHIELGKWMGVYSLSGDMANDLSDSMSISHPLATRSIAPNGTIALVAETTASAEPITSVAHKRRYLDGSHWKVSYRVDPTAQRLIDHGVSPHLIEDAFSLARDVERRIQMQAWIQGYVDHGISSTINLPPWGTPLNNEGIVTQFGNTLLKHLPKLRGITAYPDGARGGQPIVPVSYKEAITMGLNVEYTEECESDLGEEGLESQCKGDVCSS